MIHINAFKIQKGGKTIMAVIQKIVKSLPKKFSFFSSISILFILILLSTMGCNSEKCIQTDNVVSFLANVDPDSFQKVFTVVIGTKQATPSELNNLLRPEGGKVFIVTSITSYHITPRNESPFSVIGLLGLTESGSTRGWGAGTISVSERETTHVDYRPGIVVLLTENESLAVRSFIQSNDKARVEVHGYLKERPEIEK